MIGQKGCVYRRPVGRRDLESFCLKMLQWAAPSERPTATFSSSFAVLEQKTDRGYVYVYR